MGIGFSLILIAIGAILAFAVDDTFVGVDSAAIGVILMVVGALGLVLTLLFWSSFSPYADALPSPARRRRVVHDPGVTYDDPGVVRRTTIDETLPAQPAPVDDRPRRRTVIEESDPPAHQP